MKKKETCFVLHEMDRTYNDIHRIEEIRQLHLPIIYETHYLENVLLLLNFLYVRRFRILRIDKDMIFIKSIKNSIRY